MATCALGDALAVFEWRVGWDGLEWKGMRGDGLLQVPPMRWCACVVGEHLAFVLAMESEGIAGWDGAWVACQWWM